MTTLQFDKNDTGAFYPVIVDSTDSVVASKRSRGWVVEARLFELVARGSKEAIKIINEFIPKLNPQDLCLTPVDEATDDAKSRIAFVNTDRYFMISPAGLVLVVDDGGFIIYPSQNDDEVGSDAISIDSPLLSYKGTNSFFNEFIASAFLRSDNFSECVDILMETKISSLMSIIGIQIWRSKL